MLRTRVPFQKDPCLVGLCLVARSYAFWFPLKLTQNGHPQKNPSEHHLGPWEPYGRGFTHRGPVRRPGWKWDCPPPWRKAFKARGSGTGGVSLFEAVPQWRTGFPLGFPLKLQQRGTFFWGGWLGRSCLLGSDSQNKLR